MIRRYLKNIPKILDKIYQPRPSHFQTKVYKTFLTRCVVKNVKIIHTLNNTVNESLKLQFNYM